MTIGPRTPFLIATMILLPVAGSTPAHAQEEPEHDAGMHEMHMTRLGSVVTDLANDLTQVRDKLVSLAQAIPEGTYDWRPAEGVRSVSEVFRHVASDNYFLPAALGSPAPASTGIQPDSYQSVLDYEARDASRDQVIEALEASFEHLLTALEAADPETLGESVHMFGQDFTRQGVWLLTVTHVHEHLGQMIAYARSNGVAPPWSQ
ncbi:MAG TPA: DinB family protein [Longimicrobiales bacterium]|jgi:uncharacterized damage-inducible protein DinB